MVKVRIMGNPNEGQELIQFLREVLRSYDAAVSNVRGPYANNREGDGSVRYYMSVSMPRHSER